MKFLGRLMFLIVMWLLLIVCWNAPPMIWAFWLVFNIGITVIIPMSILLSGFQIVLKTDKNGIIRTLTEEEKKEYLKKSPKPQASK